MKTGAPHSLPDSRFIRELILFGLFYVLAHAVAYFTRPPAGVVSAFWPAAGVVFTALLLTPRSRWPWILGVGIIVNVGYALWTGRSPAALTALALTNHLEPLVGVLLFQALRSGPVTFQRVNDVVALAAASLASGIVVGGVAMVTVAPALGSEPGQIFRLWMSSHPMSILLLVPAIVTWITPDPLTPPASLTRRLEAVVCSLTALVLTWLSFGPGAEQRLLFPLPYMVVIPLAWAAVRFGAQGASGVSLLVAATVFSTLYFPEANLEPVDPFIRVAKIHLFLGTHTAVALLIAAGFSERAAATITARESEVRFRTLFERSTRPVAVFHQENLTLYNNAFAALFGLNAQTAARTLALSDLYDEDSTEQIREAPRQLQMTECTLQGRHSGGAVFPVAVRSGVFQLDGNQALLLEHRDLAEEIRAQREVRRLNRVLRAITAGNEALLRAGSENELVSTICRSLAESEGYRLAWVGYIEHDVARTIRPVAAAGFEAGYLESIVITWADTPNGQGPTGRAVREARPVVCRDSESDPNYAPWRAEAVKRGYRSSIALPLRGGGSAQDVIGVLNLYAPEPEVFDPEEVKLLEELASSLTYGILSQRTNAAHVKAEAEVRRLLAEAEQGRRVLLSLIEDQRRSETALEHSEQRYREAMHNAAIGMALVSIDGRWVEVNPALCRILGYTREELLGASHKSFTVAEDLAASLRSTEDLLAGRTERFELEKRYRHKSGRIVWAYLSVSLVRDNAGQPLHFVAQTQDITGRKLAEESLSGMTERLALALRASSLGVWRYHLQTRETEWDARMFEIFGLPKSSEAPSLDTILGCVAPEDRAVVQNSWRALPSCNRSYRLRIRVAPQGQPERHVDLHGMVQDDVLGRPAWVIGVAGDITDIIKATAESEQLRTQLLQAQKMETLGQLAAGVAHDFNNLLTGINGFVELASSSLPPGHEAYELLGQARRGALSARDLVRRILNFSRTNHDQPRQIINLAEVVRETAPLIAATLPPNISLAFEIADGIEPVLADPSQLQQILLNLCTNGAHAIGERQGEIRLGVRRLMLGAAPDLPLPAGCAAGAHIELSVRDNGCGMDASTARRIFEPFFTTKRSEQGTGLGLPIVKDIVSSHRGGIDVTSEPGIGTTFFIYLPVTQRVTSEASGAADLPVNRGNGQRILVVDDEPTVARVARVSLEKAGFSVEMFTSPDQAFERFIATEVPFDLLLVDHNMPGITGPELIQRIHRVSPDLPTILMSGRHPAGSARIDLDGRLIGALNKPFEIADLVAAVKAELAARRSV